MITIDDIPAELTSDPRFEWIEVDVEIDPRRPALTRADLRKLMIIWAIIALALITLAIVRTVAG